MRLRAVAITLLALSCAGFASPVLAAKAKPKPKPEPPLPAVHAPYVVADVDSGRVIEESDSMRPWYPASTTKLMTAYVTFRAIRAGELTLSSKVLYGANAANQPASKMGFKPGTTLTLEDALKMMMVKSANDIAVAVAETVGGSIAGFSNRMNEEAKRLGMTGSHYVNPNGLPDENQYTTARDMALLGRALLTEFPEYRSYFSLPAIEIGGRVLKNFNTLLVRYPGATGLKTGFICASGYNLVASAKRGTREVIAVVFGQFRAKARTERAAKLLDDGFGSPLPQEGETFATLAEIKSSETYDGPMDMRPYVCGGKRVTVASDSEDSGDDAVTDVSHLTAEPLDLGPPVKVSALIPLDYGDPGFVAPLPHPRPGPGTAAPDADVLNAYAPSDEAGDASGPADAIGATAGSAHPLDSVAPQ